jgi:hypothetical protein
MMDDDLKAIYLEDLYSRVKKLIQESEAELGIAEAFAINVGFLQSLSEIEKLQRR